MQPITIALNELQQSILRRLIGRNLCSIAAIQLEVFEQSIRAPSFCFFLREPHTFSAWDRESSFVSFGGQDRELSDGYIISVLTISSGIDASEVPFEEDTQTPGPCSLIAGWINDFVIDKIQIVQSSWWQCDSEGVGSFLCHVEAGLLLKSNDSREFLILADQTGDLYFYPHPNHAEIFVQDRLKPGETTLSLAGEL